jgi:hypothetical protein
VKAVIGFYDAAFVVSVNAHCFDEQIEMLLPVTVGDVLKSFLIAVCIEPRSATSAG